jgi:hypothetical protein
LLSYGKKVAIMGLAIANPAAARGQLAAKTHKCAGDQMITL